MATGNGTDTISFPTSSQVAQYDVKTVTVDSYPNEYVWSLGANSISQLWGYLIASPTRVLALISTTSSSVTMRTDNGITWTQGALNSSINIAVCAYGAGLFLVSASATTNYQTSPDGATWTNRTFPTSAPWSALEYLNGMFWLFPNTGTVAYSSSDGINWNTLTITAGAWNSISFQNGVYVVTNPTTNAYMYSTDGTTWNASTLPNIISRSCAGKDVFIGIPDNSTAGVYSYDGVNWFSFVSPAARFWTKFKFLNFKFRALASNETAVSWYSTNGFDWSNYNNNTGSTIWMDIAATNTYCCMVNATTALVVYKPYNTRTVSNVSTEISPAKSVVGTNISSVTITGQTGLLATDCIDAWIQGNDSTASHNSYEHKNSPIKLSIMNVVAGVGFDIVASSEYRIDGDFKVRWAWAT